MFSSQRICSVGYRGRALMASSWEGAPLMVRHQDLEEQLTGEGRGRRRRRRRRQGCRWEAISCSVCWLCGKKVEHDAFQC